MLILGRAFSLVWRPSALKSQVYLLLLVGQASPLPEVPLLEPRLEEWLLEGPGQPALVVLELVDPEAAEFLE